MLNKVEVKGWFLKEFITKKKERRHFYPKTVLLIIRPLMDLVKSVAQFMYKLYSLHLILCQVNFKNKDWRL